MSQGGIPVFRFWRIILAIVVGGFLVLVLGSFEAGSSVSYTCVLCRLGRVEKTMFGLKSPSFCENECSQWYPKNVEPSHTHIWERGTCMTLLNGFAHPMGVGCRPGHYPIRLLSPSTQMNVYLHLKDRQKAKELFSNLTDAKTHDDRLDVDDESKGHLIVSSIKEWEVAGFPDTWDDWWNRWWDKHVAEQKERMDWIHSDSNTSFPEWKKRQNAASAPETKKSDWSRQIRSHTPSQPSSASHQLPAGSLHRRGRPSTVTTALQGSVCVPRASRQTFPSHTMPTTSTSSPTRKGGIARSLMQRVRNGKLRAVSRYKYQPIDRSSSPWASTTISIENRSSGPSSRLRFFGFRAFSHNLPRRPRSAAFRSPHAAIIEELPGRGQAASFE
jgi:hypothetical protein